MSDFGLQLELPFTGPIREETNQPDRQALTKKAEVISLRAVRVQRHAQALLQSFALEDALEA